MASLMRKLLLRRRTAFEVYRMLSGRNGGKGLPRVNWTNSVLETRGQWELACEEVDRLNLIPHPDFPKNWDALAALSCILSHTNSTEAVLDAGGETNSTLLYWLTSYGYQNLLCMNLVFSHSFRRGHIEFLPGDITATGLPGESFAAVACLSVIEHGVDMARYLREMARILRPGGVLITSTDYWATPIDTQGLTAYGAPVKVFTRPEIQCAISLAQSCGLHVLSDVRLESNEKVIHWARMRLRYTFVNLAFQKEA